MLEDADYWSAGSALKIDVVITTDHPALNQSSRRRSGSLNRML